MPLAHEFPNHLFLLQHIYYKYYSGLGEEEGFALRLQGNVVMLSSGPPHEARRPGGAAI